MVRPLALRIPFLVRSRAALYRGRFNLKKVAIWSIVTPLTRLRASAQHRAKLAWLTPLLNYIAPAHAHRAGQLRPPIRPADPGRVFQLQ